MPKKIKAFSLTFALTNESGDRDGAYGASVSWSRGPVISRVTSGGE